MLARLFSRHTEERSQPFVVHGPWGYGWTKGGGAYEALRNAAVWACVDVLCSSVADTPIGAVREAGDARIPVTPTPSLIREPSALVDSDVWLYQLMHSMLSDGNGWGQVTSVDQRTQRPTTIETLNPANVTERAVKGGVVQAKVAGTLMQAYPHGDLWHLPGRMIPPGTPFGLSPVEYARKSIDSSLSAEEFGYRFFTDGGHPSSIIYADRELTKEQATGIKQSFVEATRGSREPAVFGTGLKHEKVSVDPNDSQFLDLQRFAVEQACRFFRVPPSMAYAAVSGQSVTYANVSQADLDFLKRSLERYLVRFETALTRLIPTPHFARFNRNALLRSDPHARYLIHKIALETHMESVNEGRALEDLAPWPDPIYDKPGIPGAPVPVPTVKDPAPPGGLI